ncbi:MAG: hypothetical protein JWN52_6716, partial [Actinomycetia bacterium]|nr:hypothetical protein [Actinomycetes bacterium]
MAWISAAQKQRDEQGLANICGACGHPFTGTNPAVLTQRTADHEGGSRIHRSHTTNPNDGFY